jgi:phospholipase C
VGGSPIGLGSRVPLIAISPWSRGGVVDSEVSDHTSLLRFLEQWTGVHEPNISDWRRQVTGDLTSAFDFAHPDFTSPVLPSVLVISCSGTAPMVPTTQAIPMQESGPRPARALPYQPNATSRTDCSMGRFYIDMTNAGTASVHYSVAPNRFRTDGPWQYDVAAGGSLEDYFSVVTYGAGHYDLTAYGPNGFLREFAGDLNVACGALEVTSALHPMTGTLDLTYVNHGTAPVTFTTTATRYRTDGPWMTTVAAGGMQTQSWDVASMGQRWYSLAVSASSDASFARRFVGHLENGSPSITGL